MNATNHRTTPPILTGMMRRLLPGRLGEDVLEDLRREYVARRARAGRVAAWGWYAKHLVTPHTYTLARKLRQHQRANRLPPEIPSAPRSGRQRWRLGVSPIDVKLAVRMLVKYPGLTVVGGVGMAVAIAISAGFFSFFYSFLYPSLPLDEGDRIVALENWNTEAHNEDQRSFHDFGVWRTMRSVDDLAAFRTIARNLIDPTGAAAPVSIAQMTASGFRVARVPPLLGRTLVDEDEREGAAPVVVISHAVWHHRFSRDTAVIGRELRLGDTRYTVVGVMPEAYAFPVNHHYWIPLRIDPNRYARGAGPEIYVFGRLAPGVSRAEAQAELAGIGRTAAADFPETHRHLRPQVLAYTDPLMNVQDMTGWEFPLSQLMISLVLVVVAINVAVLAYARTAARRREIAIRTALGASRQRVVGQLFVEALILSAVAAAGGLVLAQIGIHQGNLILDAEFGERPFWWTSLGLSPMTVGYAAGLAMVGAAIVGIVPALQATGRRWSSRLRPAGDGGVHLGRTWTILIVAQVTVAVVALPTAVAFGWTAAGRATNRPTFPADEFLVAWLVLDREPASGSDRAVTPDRPSDARLQTEFVNRIRAEPGVKAVTMAASYPGYEPRAFVRVEGAETVEGTFGRMVRYNRVTWDFFGALDASIIAGRPFRANDPAREPLVAIVNRAFAERVTAEGNPIGRRFRYVDRQNDAAAADDPVWYEIVGVVADLYINPIDAELVDPVAYHPVHADGAGARMLAARIEGMAPSTLAGRFRAVAATVDPRLRLGGMGALDTIARQERIGLRLVAMILGFLMVAMMSLSAGGLYALMSFTVTQRRREIGIRIALGARTIELLVGVFATVIKQLAIGVGAGVGLALLFDNTSGGNLLGGRAAILLPAVALLTLTVGLTAAAGPARRGLRIQPSETLKEE